MRLSLRPSYLYDEWHQYINENTIADAILDRIIHQAHRIEMTGESMRKINKLKSF